MFYSTVSSRKICILIVFAFITSVAVFVSCNNTSAPPTVESQIANGKLLTQKHCVSCHMLPDPALIDRKSWINGVLPAMGKNLGVGLFMGQYFTNKGAAINISDWQDIVTYYSHLSPVNLVIPKPSVVPLNDWATFSVERPKKISKTMPAMTTMTVYDTISHKFYSGDAANNLFEWDASLHAKLVHHFDSPVTGASFVKAADGTRSATITCIGSLPPINRLTGKVYSLNISGSGKTGSPALIIDSLPRSVGTVAADFNKDGLMDYVTCAFGHDYGALYYLQQQTDHTFKKKIISSIAGGEQLITGDFNNDGWPDVICLFAQADEGIRMFLNDHKGGFTIQTLLRFPPVYGSSSFQLIDLNHDGKPDILYTCGDNSDFSKVLKPYHGIYIFTNQGNWKFKQTYFYHIDGATKAIAADFKHNGHVDIAAIAFFADFKYHAQGGFTYLEQTANNQYTAHEIPIDNYGRWLTMEVGDIDHDGYDDIMIGNFSTTGRGLVNQSGFIPKWDMHEPVILLKNNAGKKH